MVNIGCLPSLETGGLVFMLKRAFSVQFFIFIFVFLHFSDSLLVLKVVCFGWTCGHSLKHQYITAFKNTPDPISSLA